MFAPVPQLRHDPSAKSFDISPFFHYLIKINLAARHYDGNGTHYTRGGNQFMERLIPLLAGLLVTFGIAATVLAEPPRDPGPEVINLKMGVMVLPFTHAKHARNLNNDCLHCHTRKIGKIEGWGKDTAHKICIPCHDLEDKGPVECHQCHKK
jgi:hypothetical protein